MTTLFIDCFSGISGDMFLAALVDLGVPVQWLKENLRRLPLSDFDIVTKNVTPNGIHAVKINVEVLDTQTHRHYGDICDMVASSRLHDRTKKNCLRIFEKLAEAEAKIHHCSKEDVHFHEVGAVDAIVDIVGACLGLQFLNVDQVVCSPLPMGKGFVACQHGTLPLPAPATLALVKGVPVYGVDQDMELVTPTGAAIAVTVADRFDVMPAMRIDGIGYGAGSHELKGQPNLLRAVVGHQGESKAQVSVEKLVVVETTIDDMNPEFYGYLMEKLLAEGALDVVWVPVHMKKNRPGTLVHVLCSHDKRMAMVERILRETTSLGVRYHEVFRTTLPRKVIEIETEFGNIPAKQVQDVDGGARVVPEFEACRTIALSRNIPLRKVYDAVTRCTLDPEEQCGQ